MADIEVQLVDLSTKRRRRGEPEFRDTAWADGGPAAGALPLVALPEADRGAVVAWEQARLVERNKRTGAAA
jgi:hypothetical protein